MLRSPAPSSLDRARQAMPVDEGLSSVFVVIAGTALAVEVATLPCKPVCWHSNPIDCASQLAHPGSAPHEAPLGTAQRGAPSMFWGVIDSLVEQIEVRFAELEAQMS